MFRPRVTGPFVGGLLSGAAIAVTVLAVEAFRPTALLVSAGSHWSLGSYGPTDLFATVDLRLLIAAGALATGLPLGWRAVRGRSTSSAATIQVVKGVLVGPVLVAGALVAVFFARFFVLDITTVGGFDPLSLAFLAVFAVWVAAPTLLVGLVPTGVGAGLVLCAVVGFDRVKKRRTETSNEGYR